MKFKLASLLSLSALLGQAIDTDNLGFSLDGKEFIIKNPVAVVKGAYGEVNSIKDCDNEKCLLPKDTLSDKDVYFSLNYPDNAYDKTWDLPSLCYLIKFTPLIEKDPDSDKKPYNGIYLIVDESEITSKFATILKYVPCFGPGEFRNYPYPDKKIISLPYIKGNHYLKRVVEESVKYFDKVIVRINEIVEQEDLNDLISGIKDGQKKAKVFFSYTNLKNLQKVDLEDDDFKFTHVPE